MEQAEEHCHGGDLEECEKYFRPRVAKKDDGEEGGHSSLQYRRTDGDKAILGSLVPCAIGGRVGVCNVDRVINT